MRLRVLGTLELAGGIPVSPAEPAARPLRSPKVRRLLAALLVRANAVAGVDWLAEVLWADRPPASVEGAVYTLVSRLRRELRAAGPQDGEPPAGTGPAVLTRAPGYVLRVARGDVDAGRFEDQVGKARASLPGDPAAAAALLDEALALWRGPAYAEFAEEDFARAEAARLEELRVTALEERVAATLALGRHDDAVARLEELLAEHPLRERPHAQLMVALYRAGRQADALQTYRRYRDHLGDELGLEPSADLQRLETAILRQDDAELGPSGTPASWAPAAPTPVASVTPAPAAGETPATTPAPAAGPAPSTEPAAPAQPPTTPAPGPAAATGAAAGTPPEHPAGNLPRGLPELVGRDEVLGQVEHALGRARVLTLSGPGGVGKTTLALHAAARQAERFPGGAWVVELAPLADPAAVADAVATALAVRQRPEPTAAERLVGHLRPLRVLLVLDNCEHLVDAAARLVDRLVRDCPDVTVLATSREPLGIDQEHVWPVAPLAVPPHGVLDVDRVARSAAVTLFVERATAGTPGFALDAGNVAAVAEICRRLDGLPLAIELAASRMRSLSPGEVLDRLAERFRFLRSSRRLAAERHRTLRAVVDWSYGMLTEPQRRCFDRLSVFAGGFLLAAAERVAGDGGEVAGADGVPDGDGIPEGDGDGAVVEDLLAALVDRSLVTASTSGGGTRYTLLETLRAYGRERLAERGETAAVRRAHAEHLLELAEEAGPWLVWPDPAYPADAVERAMDDLRAAHAWALEHDLDLATRMVAALLYHAEHRMLPEIPIWAERTGAAAEARGHRSPLLPVVWAVAAIGPRVRGELSQAADLARRGVAAAPPGDPVRRQPLMILTDIVGFDGRVAEAERHAAEAEQLALAVGDDVTASFAIITPALYCAYTGDLDSAAEHAARARERAERSGSALALAWSRYVDGEVRLDTEPEEAIRLMEDAVARARALDDQYLLGVALVSAASLRARHGDPEQALPLFRDVINHWHRVGNWTQQWTTIRNVFDLLVRVGSDEAAAVLYGALSRHGTTTRLFGPDATRLTSAHETLRSRCTPETVTARCAEGAAMPDDAVVSFARKALADAHETATRHAPAASPEPTAG